MTETAKDTRSPEEIIDEVLSRYTVRDLTEQTLEQLHAGEERLFKSEPPTIVAEGEANMIRWWRIENAKGKRYEVRRFENFIFCSCMDFFFRKSVCKHAAITVKFYCERCQKLRSEFGRLCEPCQMDTSPYLKISNNAPGDKVAGIRI